MAENADRRLAAGSAAPAVGKDQGPRADGAGRDLRLVRLQPIAGRERAAEAVFQCEMMRAAALTLLHLPQRGEVYTNQNQILKSVDSLF